MADNFNLLTESSMRDLFLPLLKSAVKSSNLKVSQSSEVYILSLLESCLSTDTLFLKNQETGSYDEPMLAESFLKALQEEEAFLKRQQLKKLGDSILLKTGFFADALRRKLSGLDYYIQMGSSVYGSLYSDSQNPVHKDLSRGFSKYVDIVSDVGQKINFRSGEDLVLLFDRYFEGDSRAAESKLIELGVIPVKIKKASNQ